MTSRRKLWLSSIVLYALFVSWYTDFGGPLTEAEIQAYISKTENLDLGGDPSARGALLEFLRNDTGGQFLMFNAVDLAKNPPPIEGAPPDADGQTSIGWGMPAISVQVDANGVEHRTPVLLYFGIIDFLQRYNTRKKVEKLWKTTLRGPSVSVADPVHYANRFMSFMKGVFVDIGDQFGEVEGMEFV